MARRQTIAAMSGSDGLCHIFLKGLNSILSASVDSVESAGIAPERFVAQQKAGSRSRTLIVAVLALLVLVGLGLRATQLGAEGLSEDELNKLQAVEDYRARGLTATNGEHPMLMKALLTVSVIAAERWN